MTLLAYSLLVGLAAYRLWRILAVDTLAEGFRDWLTDKADESMFWAWVADLLLCPWCWGYWLSLGLAYAVAEWQDYGAVEFALVALVGSVVCGVAHHAVERLTR